jgi:hypothetical protein
MTDTREGYDKWKCQFCKKEFSHNYKYKTHLKRCLVHCQHVEQNNNIMLELKTELKDELRLLFHGMLNEIKGDLQANVKQVIPQQPIIQKKRVAFPF